MAKIYVASSWRNPHQPHVVTRLREAGHEVYDFCNPPNRAGFGWRQVALDPGQERVDCDTLTTALAHPIAQAGFNSDHEAMEWADTFVMVLPCGKSAHLELGWACGRGKTTVVFMPLEDTPELMYLEADLITGEMEDVLEFLRPRRDGTSWIANSGLI